MVKKKALILGATGLVGRSLLQHLLNADQYDSVLALARREIPTTHRKLIRQVVNFDRLPQYRPLFAVDDVFCCLGTTMAKAKTKEAFRGVDYGYPLRAARLAHEMGARQYLLVSALGANPRSSIFYNRVKGELEREISALGLQTVHIFRPSLLLGQRTEHRAAEAFFQKSASILRIIMRGPLAKYLPITAETVAQAMVHMASRNETGIHIHESNEMQKDPQSP
jgi:uncharacterized protein YbjT (DUF2867 family)